MFPRASKISAIRIFLVSFQNSRQRDVFRGLWLSRQFDLCHNCRRTLRYRSHPLRVPGAIHKISRVREQWNRLFERSVTSTLLGSLQRARDLRAWLCVHLLFDSRSIAGETIILTCQLEWWNKPTFKLKSFPVLAWLVLSAYHLVDFMLYFTPFYGIAFGFNQIPLIMWCDISEFHNLKSR